MQNYRRRFELSECFLVITISPTPVYETPRYTGIAVFTGNHIFEHSSIAYVYEIWGGDDLCGCYTCRVLKCSRSAIRRRMIDNSAHTTKDSGSSCAVSSVFHIRVNEWTAVCSEPIRELCASMSAFLGDKSAGFTPILKTLSRISPGKLGPI